MDAHSAQGKSRKPGARKEVKTGYGFRRNRCARFGTLPAGADRARIRELPVEGPAHSPISESRARMAIGLISFINPRG